MLWRYHLGCICVGVMLWTGPCMSQMVVATSPSEQLMRQMQALQRDKKSITSLIVQEKEKMEQSADNMRYLQEELARYQQKYNGYLEQMAVYQNALDTLNQKKAMAVYGVQVPEERLRLLQEQETTEESKKLDIQKKDLQRLQNELQQQFDYLTVRQEQAHTQAQALKDNYNRLLAEQKDIDTRYLQLKYDYDTLIKQEQTTDKGDDNV